MIKLVIMNIFIIIKYKIKAILQVPKIQRFCAIKLHQLSNLTIS